MNNPAEQSGLAVGSKIGPFELTVLLGRGGMGEVWRGRDTRLERFVAIKLLPRTFAANPDRLRRFELEAKTLASLNHPNILVIFEVGDHHGVPYLVSELLEGQTLRQELSQGPLSQRKAMEYGVQMAHGLAAAHARGVIHRDLKPENVFVTRDHRIKILDFGLAKFEDPAKEGLGRGSSGEESDDASTAMQSTAPGLLLGTPGYMSPEQVRGQAADQRSDIFAFGAILYEMLSGQKPFKRESGIETMHSILNEEPRDLRELQPNVSPLIDRLVRRCMEKQPENRFQTAKDLAFAMENTAAVLTPEITPVPTAMAAAVEPPKLDFRSEPPSAISPGMSSPEPKVPTLQELPELRRKTERISKLLFDQLSGHLETLRPLFAPERLFGKLAGGKTEQAGAERALADLQQSYRPFTAKPYDLPATLDANWLPLIGQTLALEPWAYDITLDDKTIAMSTPIKWVLVYRSNYSLAQVKRVLSGAEAVRLEHLRQFVVNALALQLLFNRYPKLQQLIADLGWDLQIAASPEFKGLPLVTATSLLSAYRPPDDLILAATAFSGVPAFIELIDLNAAKNPRNPLQQRLEEVLRG